MASDALDGSVGVSREVIPLWRGSRRSGGVGRERTADGCFQLCVEVVHDVMSFRRVAVARLRSEPIVPGRMPMASAIWMWLRSTP